jgi:hypothetical protein
MTNYYYKIFLEHKKKNPAKSPAPKNFWPFQYQFYMCNPIPTFTCIIEKANSNPKIKILNYIAPEKDRSKISSIMMPTDILKDSEIEFLFKKAKPEELMKMINLKSKTDFNKIKKMPISEKRKILSGIDETLRSYLPLRDTDKISVAKNSYSRRIN